ncbi:PQQ-binding-like beta-propeller repeat protein [Halogeometricum sp. S1BR25-6]|uniref:PQQ-binding-like beta-propeller repeat protein n=1 Tax=Halogeometricum salsisoli TaxID=2950536 RepID=A0ABU2GAA4_9EURY|nr:PQQ-binding-like beta-propeller repeat protein [Halogeometricum sp. S1BR25-6]MDS0297229.1 PQQ-binding-like beta-propeller repeat protein [Halogeometricum sp. S1BR25-6]
MGSYTRRAALRSLPALAVGLSGCSALSDDEDDLPLPTAWVAGLRETTTGIRPIEGVVVFASRSPFSNDPMLSAVDADVGETTWSVSGPDERCSPAATDGRRVYVFSKTGAVFAFEHETGAPVWEASIPAVNRADPGVVQFAPVVAGETVVVPVSGTEDDVPDRLVGFARSDGAERFSVDLPASLAGAPASHGEGVVFALLDGTLRRVGTDGTGIDAWRLDVGAAMSDVAVDDGTVYVGSATESVLAVDVATGEIRWRADLENTVFTRPLVADGRVFVGAADYYLYAFDADSGERRWRTETPNAVTAGPTTVDGKLVTLSGGDARVRGASGTVPFAPTVLSVHDTDGTQITEQRFEGYQSGGQLSWAAAIGEGVYLGQEWQVARLAPEVLDAA